jgi:hypothetical protein
MLDSVSGTNVRGVNTVNRKTPNWSDAADHIPKLPRAEQDLAEWQTAVGCLFGAAEGVTS